MTARIRRHEDGDEDTHGKLGSGIKMAQLMNGEGKVRRRFARMCIVGYETPHTVAGNVRHARASDMR